MSAMSVGKMPKALFRPLRAGNSRAGERPGKLSAGEPGPMASRPERQNVRGMSGVARRDMARPGPRVAGKSPARPRLWVVPDVPGPAGPGSRPGTPAGTGEVTSGGCSSGRAGSRPGGSGSVSTPPAGARPGVPGSRGPGDAPARQPREAGSLPLVPRPRMAPDDQIPAQAGIRPAAPGRPRHAGPGVAPARTRVVRPAFAPARVPVHRVRRTRLTRRGRRLVWVSAVLLVAAVITPVLLALASGAQAASHGVPPSAVRAGMREVVVQPGDSLWSVALRAEPKADPRVVVQQIMDYNALGSQVLVPGENLWVPRG